MSTDIAILNIEEAIISRLHEKLPEVKIIGFPDNPDKYTWTNATGEILVNFQGAGFSDPIDPMQPIQIEEDEFLLNISIKGLRTHSGAYAYIERVMRALTGYSIPGQPSSCLPLRPKNIRFRNQRAGIWTYGFLFKLKRKVCFDPEVND